MDQHSYIAMLKNVAEAYAEIEAMKIENLIRERANSAPAYGEQDFRNIVGTLENQWEIHRG